MGVADRVYMRRPGPSPIDPRRSWTLRFVVLLVASYVLTRGAPEWWGWRGLPSLVLSREALESGRIWTLVTAALVHADTASVVFNALGLWFFGRLAEETLGAARYVAFFFLAAVAAHVPFVALEFLTHRSSATVGASGIVFAMMVLAACRYPGLPVRLVVVPMLLWQLAALFGVIGVIGVVSRTGAAEHWTMIGGAAFGWCVHRFGILPKFRIAAAARAPHHEPGPYRSGNARAEIDRLLDKINAEGIGSLTDEERETLKRGSDGYR